MSLSIIIGGPSLDISLYYNNIIIIILNLFCYNNIIISTVLFSQCSNSQPSYYLIICLDGVFTSVLMLPHKTEDILYNINGLV